jgi:D-proline reductase (dithiol) PrdB
MSELKDLSLKDRIFMRAYKWRRIDPVPWTPLKKPLAESRLGIVSSAGLSVLGQEPFNTKAKGGDPTFREIPGDTNVTELQENHRSQSWDHRGVEQDKNLAFPIDRAKELVQSGRVGSLSGTHVSVMGSITAPGRFVRDYVPQIAEIFVREEVDVALLVPV